MSVTLQYDASQQLLVMTLEGELLDQDLLQLYHRARWCSANLEIRRGILNGLKIKPTGRASDTVKSMARQPSMLPEDSDSCVVADEDYVYGLARMYQMLGGKDRDRLRVVRTLQEAYDILKIHAPVELELVEC